MYNGRMAVEPSDRTKAHRRGRKAGHVGGTTGWKVVPPRRLRIANSKGRYAETARFGEASIASWDATHSLICVAVGMA